MILQGLCNFCDTHQFFMRAKNISTYFGRLEVFGFNGSFY